VCFASRFRFNAEASFGWRGSVVSFVVADLELVKFLKSVSFGVLSAPFCCSRHWTVDIELALSRDLAVGSWDLHVRMCVSEFRLLNRLLPARAVCMRVVAVGCHKWRLRYT